MIVANINNPSTKGQPFQMLDVDCVMAPITTGPIQDDALLTIPNNPKKRFSFPLGTNSANMVC